MSQMRVPVTDAFDDTDQFESLEVELTPKQIEWLEQNAEERGLSLDHMLRSIITAQIRGTDDLPSAPTAGDGAPQSPQNDSPDTGGTDVAEDRDDDNEDSPSIVESLRSATERLQDLTEEEEAEESDLHDTLSRLQSRMGGSSAEDEENDGVLIENDNRSMFDMMEDE
jgi:hypothetical protein